MNKARTLWIRQGEQGFEAYVKIISDTVRQAFDYAVANGLITTSARNVTFAEVIDIRSK